MKEDKSLSGAQVEQILNHIPGTSVIFYDKDLKVHRISGQAPTLKEIFPDFSTLTDLSKIESSAWSDTLEEICRSALHGKPVRQQLPGPLGPVGVQTFSLEEVDKEPLGVLLLHSNQGMNYAYNTELERGKEKAEETSETKSLFMASISHEFRTPLNAIIGFIEQMQKTSLSDVQERYLKIIDKSSSYLLDLVNEILTFSKMESGEFQLDELDFNLELLIEDVYNTMLVKAEEKRINLNYRFDEELKKIFYGDAFRLKQIILNLVSNAIKFTEYGFVEVQVTRLKKMEDKIWIRILVIDSGIGIPNRRIGEIFKEYKQASSGITRRHGGTGLGLTISKRLTEWMGGSLAVESKEGKGSTFTVEIPLKASKLSYLKKEIQQITSQVLAGKSALIVDDDAMNRMLGQVILEGYSMEVVMASDGKEAMKILDQTVFDIILLDIHMPDVSGIEVARYARKSSKNHYSKIIAVTAELAREKLDKYRQEPIDDFLIKPYREINLYNKICKQLAIEVKEIPMDHVKIKLHGFAEDGFYDLNELRSVTKKNKAFFNEMVETFISNAMTGINQIKAALEQQKWKTIEETSHRLIPSFKHLKINKVVSDLTELKDKVVSQTDLDRIKALVIRIETDTLQVIEHLKNEKE